MSYQITYGPNGIKTSKKQRKSMRKPLSFGIIIAILFGVLRFSSWDNGLGEYLIPGNADVTKSAFRNFTECLQNGESFSDAVYVFCDTVIQGAALEK